MKSILKALLVSVVMAEGEEDAGAHGEVSHAWDYTTQNGANWSTLELKNAAGEAEVNQCLKGANESWNQSPIDLRNDWPQKAAEGDRFNKIYSNVDKHDTTTSVAQPKAEVIWNGHTTQVDFPTGNLQRFSSQHGKNTFGAASDYTGVQFHFHHRSEHTIEGRHHDLEMHTVNGPVATPGVSQNGFIAAAMGLMFSVNDYTREMEGWETEILDNFFEGMKWDDTTTQPKLVDMVSYGDLMTMVDMNNRWTYRGSVTTPPCAQNVYWNVLRTVYPIKQAQLDNFKKQLARAAAPHNICTLSEDGSVPAFCVPGNHREVMPLSPDHNPFVITDGEDITRSIRALNIASENQYDQTFLKTRDTMATLREQAQALAGGNGPSTMKVAEVVGEDSSALTTVITVLLIIAILFLLLAVIIVTKNSFNKPVAYQGVELSTLPTDRAN